MASRACGWTTKGVGSKGSRGCCLSQTLRMMLLRSLVCSLFVFLSIPLVLLSLVGCCLPAASRPDGRHPPARTDSIPRCSNFPPDANLCTPQEREMPDWGDGRSRLRLILRGIAVDDDGRHDGLAIMLRLRAIRLLAHCRFGRGPTFAFAATGALSRWPSRVRLFHTR